MSIDLGSGQAGAGYAKVEIGISFLSDAKGCAVLTEIRRVVRLSSRRSLSTLERTCGAAADTVPFERTRAPWGPRLQYLLQRNRQIAHAFARSIEHLVGYRGARQRSSTAFASSLVMPRWVQSVKLTLGIKCNNRQPKFISSGGVSMRGTVNETAARSAFRFRKGS